MFWNAKIRVETEDDKGRTKKNTEQYLVIAENVTDAEVKVTKKFEGYSNLEFEVTGVIKSNILEVIE